MRVALGVGSAAVTRKVETANEASDTHLGHGSGFFELSIGGTPFKGIVFAGTLLTNSVEHPTFTGDATLEIDGNYAFNMLGGTVDWYPDPKGGFHAGGTLGLAWATAPLPKGQLVETMGGAGPGLSALIGYDWWIGSEWSIGGIARLSGGMLKGDATVKGKTYTDEESVRSLSLGLNVLFH